MLADFTENTTEKLSYKLVCESCGMEFSCGANAGKCWCFDVELKGEVLADLRKDFQSCLCQNCLVSKATGIKFTDGENIKSDV